MKPYEKDYNGRVLCINHAMLRCKECAEVHDLYEQNKRYREKLEFIQDIQQWRRKKPDYEVLNIVNKELEEDDQ